MRHDVSSLCFRHLPEHADGESASVTTVTQPRGLVYLACNLPHEVSVWPCEAVTTANYTLVQSFTLCSGPLQGTRPAAELVTEAAHMGDCMCPEYVWTGFSALLGRRSLYATA